jgi:L-lactate dehydrogenase complex protein LldE
MKIQLFVTCLVDTFFPEVGESTVELLESTGFKVEFDLRQTCCGQPPFNAGFWDQARPFAIRMLDIYAETESPLILPSGSCAAMIRHGYLELFRQDPVNLAKAEKLANRTYELTEFLHKFASPGTRSSSVSTRIAYHPSCHLTRILKITVQPLDLLQQNHVEYIALQPECCGFGGTFAVDQPEISGEMLQRKLTEIQQLDVERVVACDVSCLMQIEGGLRASGSELRCSHIAQLLTGKQPGLR